MFEKYNNHYASTLRIYYEFKLFSLSISEYTTYVFSQKIFYFFLNLKGGKYET